MDLQPFTLPAPANENEVPHLVGRAYCLCCQYEWVACAPVGTTSLQCPKCQTKKGNFAEEMLRDEEHYRCDCGNWLFSITPKRIYCSNCGKDHKPFD